MRVVSSAIKALTPTCIALGNFDGVHRGHQQVIFPAVSQGRRSPVMIPANDINPLPDRPIPTVVTFDPHPREFFSGNTKRLLTPLPEKIQALEQLGVEQLVLLPFDRELASLTPEEFVVQVLIQQLQTQTVSIGMDFCFGRDRSGSATDLKAIAARYEVDVAIAPLYQENDQRISSSAIREALIHGELHHANTLLGRPFSLQGTVIKGQQLGRTIGFPTANLDIPSTKFLPKYGVYGVQVQRENLKEAQWGILNIGCRPTVDSAASNPTIEVYLFDFAQDIYGENLSLKLLHYLRPEQKFASIQALKEQIQRDCDQTQQLLQLTS
ncbi:MAG: bifunctional riboflavin kinase/FAD synthetase [Limnothrix sp. RL_2_0]|nr:bifunctional riboflavin kinase/FAD synthetase [Limnothrix sp. RL_2_0]